MRLLVTGGAGFIGANFIKYVLANHDDRIVNLDALTYAGNLENLAGLEDHERYRFVKGDIGDGELVARLLTEEKLEGVVNFAAESHVDRSIDGPRIFLETNIIGTQVLLEAVRRHGVDRFLQVSTDEVYGSLGASGLFTEDSPIAPNSPYAASKASADLVCRAYHHTYGMPVMITRCSNNYGPYQFPEKLIPLMIANALEDKQLPVYGDGKNVRDWLYVEDHCRALDVVLRKGRGGEVYNIGGNNEMENIAIVKLLLQKLNKPESLVKYVDDRPGHDRRYAIDASHIKSRLDWEPAHVFADGLQQTIDWYLENRTWWETVRSGAYRDYYQKMYGESGRHDST
jgi:dTDP-glucose 4,6-dehydratase